MSQTPAELAILRKYAGGAGLTEISEALRVPHAQVVAVVESVGFTRTRAAAQIRQHEVNLNNERRKAVAPPPTARPTAPQVAKEATVHPEPALQLEPLPDTIEQRLLRAEAIPRLKTKAARIRAMLEDLGRDLEGAAQVVEAERKVERLRADLAAATEALRQMTRPAAKKPAATDAPAAPQGTPDPVDVRKWAADNGVDCNPKGRVKQTVIDRYLAAQQLAA